MNMKNLSVALTLINKEKQSWLKKKIGDRGIVA